MKNAFWKADWFLGVVIAVGVLIFNLASNLIPGLERWAYDLGVRMTSKTPSDKIAVIAIDEQSISNIGRWPWPRDVQAKLIDQLSAAKAKVIGNTIFFFEPQKDPGLAYVDKMLAIYDKAWPADGSAPQAAAGVFGARVFGAEIAFGGFDGRVQRAQGVLHAAEFALRGGEVELEAGQVRFVRRRGGRVKELHLFAVEALGAGEIATGQGEIGDSHGDHAGVLLFALGHRVDEQAAFILNALFNDGAGVVVALLGQQDVA